MRKVIVVAAVCLVLAADSGADIVYLRSGKILRGPVTRKDGKVQVETSAGVKTAFLSEVVHIVHTGGDDQPARPSDQTPVPPEEPPVPPAPLEVPATQPAGADTVASPRSKAFRVENAVMPESMVYFLERIMARTPPGESTYYLRRDIEAWRVVAHERKRRSGPRWVGPKDFVRHRRTYVKYRAEAADLIRQAYRLRSKKKPEEIAERRRLAEAAHSKAARAASVWADPLLKRFLMGLAFLDSGDYRRAAQFFKLCVGEAPLVAAFHQAYGQALLHQQRALPALEAFVMTMRLKPNLKSAELQTQLELIKKTMQKVPGRKVTDPIYVAAEELVAEYDQQTRRSSYTSRRSFWLMPAEKSWQRRDNELPVPPYDRLVFRQCLGVPLGTSLLMVDTAAVKEALAMYVQIDEDTVVPAEAIRTGAYKEKARLPVTLVGVPGCLFEPVDVAFGAPPKNSKATMYAVNFMTEMGSSVRLAQGKVISATEDGAVDLTVGPAAGEGVAPVFNGDGALMGLRTGRTDVRLRRCGMSMFLPPGKLAELLEYALSRTRDSSRRSRQTEKTRSATGRCFVVYAIASELLEE